jgi:hypothetical protein
VKSAFEQCVDRKADRFIVYDDGGVFVQSKDSIQPEPIAADATVYLAATAGLTFGGEPQKVNELVPEKMRSDWRLGVQRENGYSVWTPYFQRLPSFTE